MSQVASNHEVLTLEEAAVYLRVSTEATEQLAIRGAVPARRIDDEWRFLKGALDDWLRGPDHKQALLGQAGALKDDDRLDELRNLVYAQRGRPEAADAPERLMHLLDTDTLTHLHAGHPRVIANLQALDDPFVGITVVTKIEILRARYDFVVKASDGDQLLRAQQRLEQSELLISELLIISFDEAAASQFDALRQITKLRKIGRVDLLIGAIALANRATLVTLNLRHFRQIPQLSVINWVDD